MSVVLLAKPAVSTSYTILITLLSTNAYCARVYTLKFSAALHQTRRHRWGEYINQRSRIIVHINVSRVNPLFLFHSF